MDSLTERLSYKKSNRDHKQSRLSKSSIGHPMERNGQASNTADQIGVDGSGTGPSMSMKVIVVHRDERGYGLTLSGDNPVYVQSVKDDGPAAKAGVVQGDRLLKVNGELVLNKNHVEVVKLFKADKYVALTLLATPPSTSSDTSQTTDAPPSANPNPSSEASIKASANKNEKGIQGKEMEQLNKENPFYVQKVQTIKKMLEHEQAEVERIKEEYARNPHPNTLKNLGQAQKLLQDLKKQLWKVESNSKPSVENPPPVTSPPTVSDTEVDGRFKIHPEQREDQISLINMDDPVLSDERVNDPLKQAKSPGVNNVANSFNAENLTEKHSPVMVIDEDKANMDLVKEFLPNNPFMDSSLISENGKAAPLQQNADIMNFEDDDIAAEIDAYQDHGPFNDLETLRQRPAHLAVFFNYVIGTKEPAEFLLTLAVDSYKQLPNTKDMVKFGDTIFKTYLGANAVFKVDVDNGISQSTQQVLNSKNPSEEGLRGIFDPAVQVANKKIRTQLAEYRTKREQGLGSLFGDEKLHHAIHIDQQSDIRIVDEIISPTLTEWLQKVYSIDDGELARQTILSEALQNFLNQYGTKKVKKPTSRIYSIIRPKPAPPMRPSKSMGNQDSTLEDNRKSGIGGFFKGRRRNDSNAVEKVKNSNTKRDKGSRTTIWENVPGSLSDPLKPVKVGVSAESSIPAGTGLNEYDERNSAQGKRSERSESMYNPISVVKEAQMVRPKSMPLEERKGRAQTVTIMSTPSLQEAVFNDHNPPYNEEENENTNDDAFPFDRHSRRRRERRDEEKRLSMGSNKSNSDPDKSKVLQAVVQHNASIDQSDTGYRPHALSSAEFTLSLNIEGKQMMDQLPNFNNDPEVDIDATERQWTEIAPKSVVKDLEKKEIKRQQIINELMSTEQHHVRDLKIIEQLFYEHCLSKNLLTEDEINVMFPNLKEILNLHRELNKTLTDLKERDGHVVKTIGDSLLSRFDGEGGNIFMNECASYCGNQSAVLSFIKEKSKKDQNFKQFLQVAQRHPVCRKFHLKDFIPLEFQRLTKYPLLLENIAKNTKKKQESEIEKVKKACDRCREILAFVNQTVKEEEDKQKIREIQRCLDREPLVKVRNPSTVIKDYKEIDLTDRSVIHQGPLTWRIGLMEKRKAIPLHCILYDDVLVLLQKQDDRYVLKCQGAQADKSTGGSHAPFIRMDGKVIVRNVATDKKAFFVMPTSDVGPQMYELAATTSSEMKQWTALITKISNKKRDLPKTEAIRRPAFSAASTIEEPAGNLISRAKVNLSQTIPMRPSEAEYQEVLPSPTTPISNDLILKIKEKHQEINRALSIKFKLLAQLSGLAEDELEIMLDMSAADTEPDPGILIKHSILCVDRLHGLLNESATPDSAFVKSRNQSQVDVTSLNQLPTEPVDHSFQADTTSPPEKWATPVLRPKVRTSTTASASPIDDALTTGSEYQIGESDSVFSPGIELSATQNDSDRMTETETTKPDSESSADSFQSCHEASEEITSEAKDQYERLTPSGDQNDVLTQNLDQGDDKSSFIENVVDPSNEEEVENLLPADDQAIQRFPNMELEDNTLPMVEKTETTPPGVELEGPHCLNLPAGDDAASKSRPSSGIEIFALAGDVPVSKLMEIVMCLQTQLTQLMHVTEGDEEERLRLREENAQLKKQLQAKQNSVSVTSLPSYDDAVKEDTGLQRSRLTASASAGRVSLEQDIAAVRASFLRRDDVIDSPDEQPSITPRPSDHRYVTRRSTGF